MPDKVARLHRSYSEKPIPVFQQLGQAARFDDEFELERHKLAYFKENVPDAIPVTWDTEYNPDHPDADWNGLVRKRAQKKHTLGAKAQQVGLSHSEFGIVGDMQKVPSRPAGMNLRRSDTESLIAGIGARNDHYKTSTMAQYEFEPTEMAQMTLARRSVPKPTGLTEYYDPTQSRSNSSSRTSLYGEGNSSMNFSGQENSNFNRSVNGSYNNSMSSDGGKPPKIGSMLSNIGASIFQRVPDYNEIQVQMEFKNGAPARKSPLPSDYKRSNIRFG